MSDEYTRADPLELAETEAEIKDLASRMNGVCSQYGLHGNVIYHHPSPIPGSKCNRLYLLAARDPALVTDPLPKGFDPAVYLRRNQRSGKLVYTDVFVYDLMSGDYMDAMDKLVEYCKYTEYLSDLYRHYGLEPPDKLRHFEIRMLKTAQAGKRRPITDHIWKKSVDALNDFFKTERKGGSKKEWMDFFRSDKYPDKGNSFERIAAFQRRHDPVVSLEQLMSSNDHIHTLEMQEHEYRRFSTYMRDCFPDVPYAVSKKQIIDNGAGPRNESLEATFGKRVTGEEYDKLRDERFAAEGWAPLVNLEAAYFEVRQVSYCAVDESVVATAYNDASLRYAKCDTLETIQERGGSYRHCAVPREDFMNFVSFAKGAGVPFYVDNRSSFEVPSLAKVNVIYSSRDAENMECILGRIVDEKVGSSHFILEGDRPTLTDILAEARHQPRLSASEQKGAMKKGDERF